MKAQSGYAANVAQSCAKSESRDLLNTLDSLYARAMRLETTETACRHCAKCCRQRPVTAYAVEVAYLMLSSDGPLDSNDLEGRPCPALTEEDLCDHYSSRPFACRVFQPWSEWGPIKGCLRHPYNRDTTHELSTLLDRLAELNHAFVYRLGLHQSLDFDYLGNWAIADWFTTQEDGGDSARPWGF